MRRPVCFATGSHGLWIESKELVLYSATTHLHLLQQHPVWCHHTQVGDELLRWVDIFEQLLQELVRKSFLHGGRILLQIFQTSATQWEFNCHMVLWSLISNCGVRLQYPVSWPCDAVAIDLQEAEQVLCLLSISGLLLGCQSVVGHQQRMSTTAWNHMQHFTDQLRLSTRIHLTLHPHKHASLDFISKSPLLPSSLFFFLAQMLW